GTQTNAPWGLARLIS
nr:RecName: Full=Alkaline serine protease; Short=AkP [Termitomyces clypeatus]